MTIAFDAPAATDLARDTELLSQVLHEVLVEQNGSAVAEEVRWLHEAAAELRGADQSAADVLVERVAALPDEQVGPVIRACALQLQLANIAEERERVRRRRHYDATGTRQRESLMEAADLLRDAGADLAAAVRWIHATRSANSRPCCSVSTASSARDRRSVSRATEAKAVVMPSIVTAPHPVSGLQWSESPSLRAPG